MRARAGETRLEPAPVILTVTPNPSLDLLYTANSLRWDDANRVDEPRRRPGGQGINVSRVASALGARAITVALLGGWSGDLIASSLAREAGLARGEGVARESTDLRIVRAEAATRLFIAVHVARSGRSLLINGRGPEREPADAERLLDAAAAAIREDKPSWVAGCGSLPPGFPLDFYARLGQLARAGGARFVADCDGEALAMAAGACDLLVPNHHEAARLLGWHTIRTRAQALRAARALLDRGASLAAVTLGARGAVLVTRSEAWHARTPHEAGVAVGAGDGFLAGLLLTLGQSVEPGRALRSGVAAGAAVIRSQGEATIDAGD
jgi:1-phosphofructokinase/6-phosphofructokinase 2